MQICLYGSKLTFSRTKTIGGLKFAGGIFTNLTRDHLDYHKTVENYLKAKKAFFDSLPKTAFALTNLDDKKRIGHDSKYQSKGTRLFAAQFE